MASTYFRWSSSSASRNSVLSRIVTVCEHQIKLKASRAQLLDDLYGQLGLCLVCIVGQEPRVWLVHASIGSGRGGDPPPHRPSPNLFLSLLFPTCQFLALPPLPST